MCIIYNYIIYKLILYIIYILYDIYTHTSSCLSPKCSAVRMLQESSDMICLESAHNFNDIAAKALTQWNLAKPPV